MARYPIKFGDFVRSETGETAYLELGSPKDRARVARLIQSYATKANAKLDFTSINGFTADQYPTYLLKVVVTTPGIPKKKRGRKPANSLA